MNTCRWMMIIELCGLLVLPVCGADSEKQFVVRYSSGSFAAMKPGKELRLVLGDGVIKVKDGAHEIVSVPAISLTDVTQGIEAARLPNAGTSAATLGWASVLAKKTPRRFVGFTWENGMVDLEVRPVEQRPIVLEMQRVTGKRPANVNMIGRP